MNFNPQQQHILLSKMGYTGPADPKMMEAYLSSNPGAAARMGKFSRAAQKKIGTPATGNTGMVGGGLVPQGPGTTTTPTTTNPNTTSPGTALTDALIQNPADLAVAPTVAKTDANAAGTNLSEGLGQVDTTTSTPAVTAAVSTPVVAPTAPKTVKVDTVKAADKVSEATGDVTAVKGAITEGSTVKAEQQKESSIADMQAAQGTAYLMTNPVQREIQAGELVSGSAVDAAKVETLVSQIQAAEATPSKQATVAGQLEGLMAQFEGGKTPAWAAGAMRNAQAILAQRGLGASSMAGQAVIQAAMESAIPIAQADATTLAAFEERNLSNRQQVAVLAAEQRASFLGKEFDQTFQTRVENAAKIADIANANFTATQNIALENSRAVNSMNIANLSANNAMVMAKAAALADLDVANLNNRQQAAVQNAQNFLQMDMTNLTNEQQVEIFRGQSNVQALLTDVAQENAAKQFNATSENQANQFFTDLASRVNMFNTEQINAMNQFNAGETNASERLNAQLEATRKQFNATNSLVIAQANAVWRQNVATANTAAQNEANMEAARTSNALTVKALDEIWQKERDILSYTFTSGETDKEIAANILMADKTVDLAKWQEASAESSAKWSVFAKLLIG